MINTVEVCGAALVGSALVSGAMLICGMMRSRAENNRICMLERESIRERAKQAEMDGWRGLNADREARLAASELREMILTRENKRLRTLLEAAERNEKQ